MSEDRDKRDDWVDDDGEESFAELLAKSSVAAPRLAPGQRVRAKVLQVGAEWVFLDVGQKGEGVLDAKELLDAEGRPTAAPGDAVLVYFLDGEGGELRFTTRVGGGASGTAQLEEAWKAGIPVEGRLEQEVKGGYEVRLPGNVRAFCPFSQLGLGRLETPGEAAGRTLSFRITQFGEKGRNLVVSHRAIVEEERRARRAALRKTLREGMTVKGVVTNVREFGAFVDIGGLEGLVPVSEVAWGRTERVSDVLHAGQEVEVEVKALDWEKERFTFSLRAAAADPWLRAGTTFRQGATVAGKVARLAPFGAFVALGEGIDGLLHISKLGEGRRVSHPKEVLREGQEVRVVIDEIDAARRRISLSMAGAGGDAEEAAAWLNRPAGPMGTLGDALKAELERKRKP